MMTFEKIGLAVDDCKCLDGAFQDLQNVYARKINKPTPQSKDFSTKWERENDLTIFSQKKCEEFCFDIKSLSINQWTDENKEDIIKKYVDMCLRNGNKLRKDSIFLFRFANQLGLLHWTPKKRDKSHHDFYKSDEFSLTSLVQVNIVEVRETDYFKKNILLKLSKENEYL